MHYFSLFLVFTLIMTGCAITQESTGSANKHDILESKFSYGEFKKNLIVGKTTQTDVVKLFGSADNMTLHSKGGEVWIYDRFMMLTESNTSKSGGYGTVILIGGSSSSSNTSYSSTVKSLTVILEFDEHEVLTDVVMRSGGY